MVEGEKPKREISYCSSPLFFCFSVLSFYSLVSSSLPLSVRLSNNPLLPSLYSVLFFKFVSQNFCPLWFSFFLFLPPLSSPFSVFIVAGREGHLTTAMAQGKVATLPMSWHRVRWLVMACTNGGRVWDAACVFGQVRRARQIGRIAGKDLKSSSSLPLYGHGRRRTVPFKTTLFWFFEEKKM